MVSLRLRRVPVVVLALLLAHTTAFADYMSAQWMTDGQTAVGGYVQIEGYDGQGTAGGGLSAGQVRLTFHEALANPRSDPAPPGTVWQYSGIQDVTFPTTVNLNPDQITMGPGWSVSVSGQQGKFYSVTAFQNDYTQLQSTVTVLISGLGANASPLNFVDPSAWGSGFGVDWQDADPVLVGNPEPSTLVLGAIAVAAWLVRRGSSSWRLRTSKAGT